MSFDWNILEIRFFMSLINCYLFLLVCKIRGQMFRMSHAEKKAVPVLSGSASFRARPSSLTGHIQGNTHWGISSSSCFDLLVCKNVLDAWHLPLHERKKECILPWGPPSEGTHLFWPNFSATGIWQGAQQLSKRSEQVIKKVLSDNYPKGLLKFFWRRGWDSNPRTGY